MYVEGDTVMLNLPINLQKRPRASHLRKPVTGFLKPPEDLRMRCIAGCFGEKRTNTQNKQPQQPKTPMGPDVLQSLLG